MTDLSVASQVRVYIKPFNADGTYADDYIEVTKYVDRQSIGQIKKQVDSTEYDIGVMKPSSISLRLANETGKFSDVGTINTIFANKRTDSLVKVTWDYNATPLICGFFVCGEAVLGEEFSVFEGLLNDIGTKLSIQSQQVAFKCFGYEYLFDRMIVPYADISNGDLLSEVVYTLCNQSPLKELVTVSASNIDIGSDVTVDDKSDLENKTVKEALEPILLAGNSVLYIEDNILYVTQREPSASLQYTFYGQASNSGIENIEDIQNYSEGANRVFNFVTYQDALNSSLDATSIGKLGYRKKEISLPIITNSTKIDTIIDNVISEFGTSKREMDIICKFNADRLALGILDKISVDYPIISYTEDGATLPIFGVARFGVDRFPLSEYAFNVLPSDYFKIIAITYNLLTERMTIKLREI